MRFTKVARCVIADTIALSALLVIGLVVHLAWHVPFPLTLLQALGLELLVLAYPISVLHYDHDSHKLRDTHDRQVKFELIAFGGLAAGLGLLSFFLFFHRFGLSPAYIDTSNYVYREGTTVVLLTLALCQTLHLIFVRLDAERKFKAASLVANPALLRAWFVSLLVLLNCMYNPLFHSIFGTQRLGLADWLLALLMAAIYFALRQLQRSSREHSHHAVVQLQREVHHHK